jgi:hypothetical protein
VVISQSPRFTRVAIFHPLNPPRACKAVVRCGAWKLAFTGVLATAWPAVLATSVMARKPTNRSERITPNLCLLTRII